MVYDEFVRAYEDTVLEILDHLGIPAPKRDVLRKRARKQQSDAVNADCVRRCTVDRQKNGCA